MKSSSQTSTLRKNFPSLAASLFAILLFAGCASTEFVSHERLVDEKLPKPGNIIVYDFVTHASDVPSDSSLAGKSDDKATPPTPEEIALGDQLGEGIATQLIQKINEMGLTATGGTPGTKPQINDIVLRGYLLSVQQGDGAERVFIGFGYGASELRTVIEGYQMTSTGLRKLGSGELNAVGNKTPGGSLGAVGFLITNNPIGLIVGLGIKSYGELSGSSKVEGLADSTAQTIAEALKGRFQKQGWIN